MKTLRLLIVLCLLLSIQNGGKAGTVLANYTLYREVETAGSGGLRVLFTGLWGIIFLWLAGGLWRRSGQAYRWLAPAVIGYTLYSVGWFVLFAQADYDRGRLEAVGVTSILGLGFILWLRTRVRVFFGEKNNDQ